MTIVWTLPALTTGLAMTSSMDSNVSVKVHMQARCVSQVCATLWSFYDLSNFSQVLFRDVIFEDTIGRQFSNFQQSTMFLIIHEHGLLSKKLKKWWWLVDSSLMQNTFIEFYNGLCHIFFFFWEMYIFLRDHGILI